MSGVGERAYGEAAYDPAAATNAVSALQAGHPFSLLLAADDRQRAAELNAVLDAAAADGQTRIVTATNPLRARLTLERLLIQVAGTEPVGHDDPEVIRRIAERRGDEARVILVIEQSETLHPEVLHFLGRNAAYFPDAIPRLQVLFVGRPEFQAMLEAPDALMDEHTALFDTYRPVEPEPVFAPLPELAYETMPPSRLPFVDISLRAQFRAMWGGSVWSRLGTIGGTTVGVAAVVVAIILAMGGNNSPITVDVDGSLLPLPEPADTEPDPPVLRPGSAPDAETARLRSEFETYLSALGRDLPNATGAQKRAWFQEFLVWRARTAQPASGG